jgi:hypothetical protein
MIVVPSSTEPNHIADWAELSCLFDHKETLSRAELLRGLEDAEVDDAETVVANIWLEIERRSRCLPSKYPLNVEGNRLININPEGVPLEYVFPLLLSCHHWFKSTKINKREWGKTSKLFEEYSTQAVGNYLNGKALNIGWPRKTNLPHGFRKNINYICQLINEGQGPCDLIKNDSKDEGADIIAWIPFPDNRSNQAVLLAQCAAGKDYEDKASEPHLGTWKNFIRWQVPPIPALTFPFICADDNKWSRLSSINEGLLFDRLRLTGLCSLGDDSDIKTRISEWVAKQASCLPRTSS